MRIYHCLNEYRQSEDFALKKASSATIGKFDGIHIGHRKMICQSIDLAKSKNINSVVLAIGVNNGSLLSCSERADYLETLGVDILVECPLTKELMTTGPEDFVRNILCDTLHIDCVFVGADFSFGYKREGNARMLKEMGMSFGFETDILEKECYMGEEVSSTRVREALLDGDMELVTKLLGRPYPIQGIVQQGKHLGRTIGFPTINLLPDKSKILPPNGVYASYTYRKGQPRRMGVSNVGLRPTVSGTGCNCETTLLDFHDDIYGEEVRVELISFIRPEIKFPDVMSLKEQIAQDVGKAETILRAFAQG